LLGARGEEERLALEALGAESGSSVALLHGEPERIVFSASSEHGLFGGGLGSLEAILNAQRVLLEFSDRHSEP
jgi:hypothetical protein